MARPDWPDTMRDARSVRAGILLAVVDFAVLIMVVLWLIFVCGGGTWPAGDPDATLTLWHFAHLAIAVPALLLFALSVLFLPVWFALLAAIVFLIDVYVLFRRLAAPLTVPCSLFLLLFDFFFLIWSLMYFGFAVTAISRFGLYGDRSSVRYAWTAPQRNFTPGEAAAAAAKLSTGTPSVDGESASAIAAAGGVPSVYVVHATPGPKQMKVTF